LGNGDTTSLNGAIDELEGRQIDTLGHQLQRQTQLSWLLPFHDQPPVFLQISHQDGSQGTGTSEQNELGWRVDLTVPWGEREVSVNVHYVDGQANVKLWAVSAEMLEQITAGEAQLRLLLHRAGVELQALTVFQGQRPVAANQDPPRTHRLNVDV